MDFFFVWRGRCDSVICEAVCPFFFFIVIVGIVIRLRRRICIFMFMLQISPAVVKSDRTVVQRPTGSICYGQYMPKSLL